MDPSISYILIFAGCVWHIVVLIVIINLITY